VKVGETCYKGFLRFFQKNIKKVNKSIVKLWERGYNRMNYDVLNQMMNI
jgi:hypothetical protein